MKSRSAFPLKKPNQKTSPKTSFIKTSKENEQKNTARSGQNAHSRFSKEPERLQKALAALGVGSRREVEEWIKAGRISINGKIAALGDKTVPEDIILLDGRPIRKPIKVRKTKVLIYHKPPGEVCSRKDPEGRPSVFEKLPRMRQERWVMVGRLDINTEGLLLFTNNGELANFLMHPRYGFEREYAVRVLGDVTETMLKNLQRGVKLGERMAKFESIKPLGGTGKNQWFSVILKEGRNREVRRLWESQGILVSRLIRVRFGDIEMPRFLKLGMLQELDAEKVDDLCLELANIENITD